MYRCCFLAGLPGFLSLGNSLQSSKLFCSLRPPLQWSRSPRGWITRGRPNSPGRRIRASPSNSGRPNGPINKGAGEEFLLLSRHHVPHVPGRLGRPMYGHIAQRQVSRVSPTGQEITHGLNGPRGVNHMEVKFQEKLMPTRLAWRGTPHGFEVLRSPIFKATVVRTDLHSLALNPTMPLEKCRHYGVVLLFPQAPIQLAARQFTGEKGKGRRAPSGPSCCRAAPTAQLLASGGENELVIPIG